MSLESLNFVENAQIFDYDLNQKIQNDPELVKSFEKVASEPDKYNYSRDCRYMEVPSNINEIEPGQYCIIPTSGGGYYTQWYYYKTLNKKHMLIFQTYESDKYTYAGREIQTIPKTGYGNFMHIDNINELYDIMTSAK